MNRLVFHIARPITVWALHFITVYALISAGCAERALLDATSTRIAVALVTLVTALVLLFWTLMAGRRIRHEEPFSATEHLSQAAWWTALISLLAVVANLWPVAMMSTCNG
jgi:hypothetical protein